MKNLTLVLLLWSVSTVIVAAQERYQEMLLPAAYQGGKSVMIIEGEASFFEAKGDKGVVLAHQFGTNKESWHFMAELLQKRDIAAVSIATTDPENVLAAVTFLKNKKHNDITLIGASRGGSAIINALDNYPDIGVNNIILLAPGDYQSSAPASDTIKKLVIITREDRFKRFAYHVYEQSAGPKQLKEYDGDVHGQKMFDSEHREDVIELMIGFIEGAGSID